MALDLLEVVLLLDEVPEVLDGVGLAHDQSVSVTVTFPGL